MTIELKGLSREQVTNLLPEGLISLCWRGSVAHGMYVPKSDPDSIDDKDVMGVYIAPIEHYLGFGRQEVYEKWEGEWDCVFYELRKFIGLLQINSLTSVIDGCRNNDGTSSKDDLPIPRNQSVVLGDETN